MLTLRYTACAGTQQVRLAADRVFEKLAEYLSFTDDVQQALDWLLHQGLDWDGVRVMGLDDFLEQLREEMRSRYRQVNLRQAFSELREKLEEILDQERDGLEGADPARAAPRRGVAERPPPRPPQGARRRARGGGGAGAWGAGGGGGGPTHLRDAPKNKKAVEPSPRRYGDLFHGPQSLSYAEAVELMRAMERLKRLEEELLSGNLDAVDLDN